VTISTADDLRRFSATEKREPGIRRSLDSPLGFDTLADVWIALKLKSRKLAEPSLADQVKDLQNQVNEQRMIIDLLQTIVLDLLDARDANKRAALAPNCLAIKEAAFIIERSPATAYLWARTGIVDSAPIDGCVFINRDTLVDRLRDRLKPDHLARVATAIEEHRKRTAVRK
jgi:hypothetical protein